MPVQVRREWPVDVTRFAIGYRAWLVDRSGELRSINGHVWWPRGLALDARCDRQQAHLAPAFGCTCGTYAFDSVRSLRVYMEVAAREFGWTAASRRNIVTGAVRLWGVAQRPLIVGDFPGGYQYRSPFAQPIVLAEGPSAMLAAGANGLPVVDLPSLEAYAREVCGEQPPAPGHDDRAA